jgi:hypothetical protein
MEKGELIYEGKAKREPDNKRSRQDPGTVEEACHQAQQRICAA